jgi:hypothetical protein
LASLKDFGRLVCALERSPLPAFSLQFNREEVLAVQTDMINGRPVIYYVQEDAKDSQYLAYRVSNGIEEVLLASSVGNPTYVYSPILKVERFPRSLVKSARINKESGYTVIKLKDLASLAKVAAYKTIYDEPPLPLFLFKERGGNIVLGATMSASDNETISYFYYLALEEEPKQPFLRYSSQRADQPTFSTRLDEHGYVYLKVIRLAADHPLVKTYE